MRTDHRFLKFILILALAGFLISGWLLSTHIKFASGQALLTESCILSGAQNQGCASVAVSGYSYLFGVVPLAAVALGYYFAMLLLIFWVMRNFQASYEPLYVALNMATLAVAVSVLMFYISKYKVQSFCLGCALLWCVNLAIWPLLVKHLGLRWGNALSANLETLRPKTLNLLRIRVVRWFSVSGATVLIFAIIGSVAGSMQGNATMYGDKNRAITDFSNALTVFLPPEALGGNTSKGMKDSHAAPIMEIVKFSDFQCPACKMAAQYLRPFLLKHPNKVRLTYRNFPLDGACNPFAPNGGHRFACTAARAGICAAEQEKFYSLHDQLFDQQSELSTALVRELAIKAGLDMEKFDRCLASPSTEAQLQKEMSWGDMIQLQATPTLVINGRRLSGAIAPAQLEELLRFIESGDAKEAHSH